LEALSRGAAEFVELGRLAEGSGQYRRAGRPTDGPPGRRARFACGPGRMPTTRFADPPYDHEAASRLIALFRRTPFARILSVEHRATLALPGDDTRRYGDTALTFCYAP
jgi:hypothetical protein